MLFYCCLFFLQEWNCSHRTSPLHILTSILIDHLWFFFWQNLLQVQRVTVKDHITGHGPIFSSLGSILLPPYFGIRKCTFLTWGSSPTNLNLPQGLCFYVSPLSRYFSPKYQLSFSKKYSEKQFSPCYTCTYIQWIHLLYKNGIMLLMFFYSRCFQLILYCEPLSLAVTINLHQALADVHFCAEGMSPFIYFGTLRLFQYFGIIKSVVMSFLVFLCILFHYLETHVTYFFLTDWMNYNNSQTPCICKIYWYPWHAPTYTHAHTHMHACVVFRRHYFTELIFFH